MRRARRIAITLVISYLICSAVLGVELAQTALHPVRVPVLATRTVEHWADTVHAHFDDVAIAAADGVPLRAWYIRPQDSKGAVVLLHGVADNREGVFGFAQFMAAGHYSVLLPDSRAHGESGGGFATYGVKERDDVRRWAAWLAQRESRRCVFGFAESMGAGILLQSLDEHRFCAVVAESPFASFREAAYDRMADALNMPLWAARTVMRPAIEAGLLYAGVRYHVWLGNASPADVMARTQTPVLLIHGLADTNLRPRQSTILVKADPRAVLWQVPGAAHCGAFAVAGPEFERRVLQWFGSHAPSQATDGQPHP